MKMKNLLLTIAATFGMTALTMAQVPNYVPTNGLVGWWPFNGNANDESGNGNNGTVNGATMSADRFSNTNSAYSFLNPNSKISLTTISSDSITSISISGWFKKSIAGIDGAIFALSNGCNGADGFRLFIGNDNFLYWALEKSSCIGVSVYSNQTNYADNNWHFFVASYNKTNPTYIVSDLSLWIDGVDVGINGTNNAQGINSPISNNLFSTTIGNHNLSTNRFTGYLDDIGIWNRSLTQQEIAALYNASNCSNNTTITPQTNSLTTGNNATFNATTSDTNPTYVWQSDFGQGYVTLNNYGNYSGTNTGTLNVANVQLSEHNQPIRVITTSGNCIDTSNVAIISIADTCINTIIDTTLVTVTDTLIINTTITGLNPPNNANTIKVFPNPTNDHITIDYGNFSLMNGYQLRIENSLGQQVFQTNITQQSDYLNLTTWGGNGLYFVHIIDPQGNTIDIRKIVLQ